MNKFDSDIRAAQRKNLVLLLSVISGVAALTLILLFWLVLTKGVLIHIGPKTASESGQMSVVEGVGFSLGDSVYTLGEEVRVTLSADKFEPKTITIYKHGPSVLDVELEPSPGELIATSIPASSESLWAVDGKELHVGEEFYSQFVEGEYLLTLDNRYYKPESVPLKMVSGETSKLTIALESINGSIQIESIPTAADVYIDSNYIGKTPLHYSGVGGSYELKLIKPGYEELTNHVEITYLENSVSREYQLESVKGTIHFKATPADGVLLIDGKQYPLGDIQLPSDRPHSVSYYREGFTSYTSTFTLLPGKSKELNISLTPEFGKLSLKSTPKADIYINGVKKGSGSLGLELPAVSYRVEFRKPGFRTVKKVVTVSSQRASELHARLITEYEARRQEGTPLFVESIGMKLNRYKPQMFTMGSPPNEIGRRRNEFQIPVSFSKGIWVSQHEITEAQYQLYDNSRGVSRNPITDISWNDAALYCNWLSEQEGLPLFYRVQNGKVVGTNVGSGLGAGSGVIGYRLPTEAEWEWLAKMAKRASATVYVWGNSERIPSNSGNFGDISIKGQQTFVLKSYNDGYAGKSPVGSFKPDRTGLFDLAGNVSEWVHDFHTHLKPKSSSPLIDYMGPRTGGNHVVKGGNYESGQLSALRASFKESASSASPTVGFRIARYDQ